MNNSRQNGSMEAKPGSSSCQQYKDYMEEMELRIRYMKNDIEFKTSQMTQNVKRAHTAPPQYSSVKGQMMMPNTVYKLRPHLPTVSCSSIQPHNSMLQSWNKTLINSNNKSSKVSDDTELFSLTNQDKSNAVDCKTVLKGQERICSDRHSPKSESTRSLSLVYSSPDKRKVIYSTPSSLQLMSSTSHHFQTSATESASLPGFRRSITCPVSASSLSPLKYPASESMNKYKLIKNDTSAKEDVSQMSTLNSSIRSESQNEILMSRKICETESSRELTSQSYKHEENSSLSTSLKRRRHSSGHKFLARYQTPLKVQTAARLVSKYKLMRLSPTSASKMAPRFPSGSFKAQSSLSDRFRLIKQDRLPGTSSLVSSATHSYHHPVAARRNKGAILRKQHFFLPQENRGHQKFGKFMTSRYSAFQYKKLLMPSYCPKFYGMYNYKSSYYSYPNIFPNYLKSSFQLDKRKTGCNNDLKCKEASFKVKNLQKWRNPSRELPETNQYKWTSSQKRTSKHFVKLSRFKLQHLKAVKPCASLHQNDGLRFKWQRCGQSSVDILRHQIGMNQLKQRLKVIMGRRNIPAGSSQSKVITPTSIRPSPHSSPVKVKNDSKSQNVGRLVMIGQMLYRASSRKLTMESTSCAGSYPSTKLGFDQEDKKNSEARKAHHSSIPVQCTSSLPSTSSSRLPQSKLNSSMDIAKKSFVIKSLQPQKMKLVTVRGVRFHLDAGGRKLMRVEDNSGHTAGGQPSVARVDIGGMTYIKTGPGTLELSSHGNRKQAASRAVQRSLNIVAAKEKKAGSSSSKRKTKRRHCLFFRRFGKCQRGEACQFIHDKDKVAVCTRFLRGQCDDASACLFSHDASEHKMPVCLFYLRGLCSRQDCLYLHVKVSPDAPVCENFLLGFCPLGQKCKKLHSFVCPSYAVFGQCPLAENCPMPHRRGKTRKEDNASTHGSEGKKKALLARKKTKGLTSLTGSRPEEIQDSLNTHASVPTQHVPSPPPILSSSSSPPLNQPLPVLPSTDSVLQPQPSFISLLSAQPAPSSPIAATPATPRHCRLSSSMAATPKMKSCYEKPKITPVFLSLTRRPVDDPSFVKEQVKTCGDDYDSSSSSRPSPGQVPQKFSQEMHVPYTPPSIFFCASKLNQSNAVSVLSQTSCAPQTDPHPSEQTKEELEQRSLHTPQSGVSCSQKVGDKAGIILLPPTSLAEAEKDGTRGLSPVSSSSALSPKQITGCLRSIDCIKLEQVDDTDSGLSSTRDPAGTEEKESLTSFCAEGNIDSDSDATSSPASTPTRGAFQSFLLKGIIPRFMADKVKSSPKPVSGS